MKKIALFTALAITFINFANAQTANTLTVINATGCTLNFIGVAYDNGSLCSGTEYTTITYGLASNGTINIDISNVTWDSGSPTPPGNVDWDKIKIFSTCGGSGTTGSCNNDFGGFEGCSTTNICMHTTCGPCMGVNSTITVISYNGVGGDLMVKVQ